MPNTSPRGYQQDGVRLPFLTTVASFDSLFYYSQRCHDLCETRRLIPIHSYAHHSSIDQSHLPRYDHRPSTHHTHVCAFTHRWG